MTKLPKLRIVSDGTAGKTCVYIGGMDVTHLVRAVRWEVNASNELAVAAVEFVGLPAIDAAGELAEATVKQLAEERADAKR
jgi:hypothetical protein